MVLLLRRLLLRRLREMHSCGALQRQSAVMRVDGVRQCSFFAFEPRVVVESAVLDSYLLAMAIQCGGLMTQHDFFAGFASVLTLTI